MKNALISDVRSNLPVLEAVIAALMRARRMPGIAGVPKLMEVP